MDEKVIKIIQFKNKYFTYITEKSCIPFKEPTFLKLLFKVKCYDMAVTSASTKPILSAAN